MTITATCKQIGKQSTFTREFVRKAMVESWGWDQGKADAHLIMLEMGQSITVESPSGTLILESVN